ncbi:hypothetical protein Q8F55_000063 [Vanrija albida]|uniref:Uncharacterized protein n=1 Tax=Vanrija albida TaxID=181172 RepID=A0ABR3QC76_9TREE
MAAISIDNAVHPDIVDTNWMDDDSLYSNSSEDAFSPFPDAEDTALPAHAVPWVMPPDHSLRRGMTAVCFLWAADHPEGDGLAPLAPTPPVPLSTLETKTVRVLDLDRDYPASVQGACPGVRALRRINLGVRSRPHKFANLDTMVDFFNVGKGPQHIVVAPGLQTYVLHVGWDESNIRQLTREVTASIASDKDTRPAPRDMVLVLEPHLHGSPQEFPMVLFLGDISLGMLRVLRAGGTLRIVGVENMSPETMTIGKREMPGTDDSLQRFKSMLLAFWRIAEPDHGLDLMEMIAFVNSVQFITVDEWHVQLTENGEDEDGVDAYKLQAMWPLYGI